MSELATATPSATFDAPPPPSDWVEAVRESLTEAGLDPDLCNQALADPKTWDRVVDETLRIVDQVGKRQDPLGRPLLLTRFRHRRRPP